MPLLGGTAFVRWLARIAKSTASLQRSLSRGALALLKRHGNGANRKKEFRYGKNGSCRPLVLDRPSLAHCRKMSDESSRFMMT